MLAVVFKKRKKTIKFIFFLHHFHIELIFYQYFGASKQLSQLHELRLKDIDQKIALAQKLFFDNGRHLTPNAKKLLDQVLVEHPHNTSALNLLAMDDYLQGHYDRAIQRWKRMLPFFSEDSPNGKALRMMIAKASAQQ